MTSPWIALAPLALITFSIRLSGALLGKRIPTRGGWARAMRALPGCLIVALVAVDLAPSGLREAIAALIAAGVALTSRNLPLTMAAGIATIWALRTFL